MLSGSRRLTIGSVHRGETFSQISKGDLGYCKWALKQESPSGNLGEFVEFLRGAHGGVLKFGKHYGKLYSEVLAEDPGYCNWALQAADPSQPLADFAAFVRRANLVQHVDAALAWDSDSQPNTPPRRHGRKAVPKACQCQEEEPALQEFESDEEEPNAKRHRPAPSNAPITEAPELEADLCKVCMDAPVQTVFVPCGHMLACAPCGGQLKRKECPICRKKIKSVVRTYRA